MRNRPFLLLGAALALGATALAPMALGQGASGPFTQAQVASGHQAFDANCAPCHLQVEIPSQPGSSIRVSGSARMMGE